MKPLDEELQPAPYYVNHKKFIGQIDILDGSIDITDPCYDNGTWCAMFNYEVKPGKYNCYIFVVNFPVLYEMSDDEVKEHTHLKPNKSGIYCLDDERIVSLEIIHETEEKFNLDYALLNNNIGVDAGLCGFYNHKPDYNDYEWDKYWRGLNNLSNGCTCDCRDNGVTVSSGFGDGVYLLYAAKKSNGETVVLKLMFDDE